MTSMITLQVSRQLFFKAMAAIFFTLIFAAIFSTVHTADTEPGHQVVAGEIPHHVTVIGQYFYCAGSIISPRWILTSASCIHRAVSPVSAVIAGRVDTVSEKNANEQTVSVKSAFLHPGYNEITSESNIALLHLTSPLLYNDFVNYIPWEKENSNINSTLATVSGLVYNNEIGSSAIWSCKIQLENDETCKTFHDNCFQGMSATYSDENLCSITNYDIEFVHSDGGPVVLQLADRKRLQVGIVSWIGSCTQIFSVYTEIYHYSDWITETMKGSASAKISTSLLLLFVSLIVNSIGALY